MASSRPARDSFPVGREIDEPVRRPERDADAPLLSELFRAVHGGTLGGLDPAVAEMLLRKQAAGQVLSYRAAHPGGKFEVVEVRGEAVGRIVTDATGVGLRLVALALLPGWRGHGIGTLLLRALQAEAEAAGVLLRLSVHLADVRARRLYEKLGFRVVETRQTHFDLEWAP